MSDWLTWQLIDSAFPTGAFAHSWGLESAWHHGEIDGPGDLSAFVKAAVLQTGHAVLPLLNDAHREHGRLEALDALAEAFLLNAVANRASRIQGRTLVATASRIWPSSAMSDLKRRSEAACAHVAPLSGAVLAHLGLPLASAQRVALYTTMRGVLAAAVRLGIAGSYEAQRLQAASTPWLDAVAARCHALTADDLAQTSPLVDLAQSAHDRLYSRLFQS